MNMIEVQDKLKSFSQEQLIQQMQAPDGSAPQFMVLSEITRRKKMQDSYAAQQSKQGQMTVAEEVVAAAGVPQAGLGQMASAMAPKSSIAQNTGIGSLPTAPVGMYAGGMVRKMAGGGPISDPAAKAFAEKEAARLGISLEEYLQTGGGRTARDLAAFAKSKANRNRLMGLEPVGDGATFPTQGDLDRNFFEETYGVGPTLSPPPMMDQPFMPPGSMSGPSRLRAGSPSMPVDLDLVGDATPTLPMTREEEAIAARNELLGGLVGGFDEQDALAALAAPGAGRAGPVTGATSPTRYASPAFESSGRQPTGNTVEDKIASLRAVINADFLPAVDRARAAEELQALLDWVAKTQYGGSVGAVVNGITVPPGYIMTAMGLQPDPNYVTPGRSGYSMVDQAAIQGGTAGLDRLNGVVPDQILEAARIAAEQSDWERVNTGLAIENKVIEDQLSNQFVPQDLREDMLSRQSEIEVDKENQGRFPAGLPPEVDIMSMPGLAPDEDVMSVLGAAEYTPSSDAAVRDLRSAQAAEDEQSGLPPDATVQPQSSPQGAPMVLSGVGGAGGAGGGSGGGSGGGGGGGAGASGAGGYMSELEEALKRAEKTKEQDKWLALAQMGMALMASDEPTLGGAFGEAGQIGIESFRGARDEYENTRMTLMQAMNAQRMAAAKALGGGGGGRSGGGSGAKPLNIKDLDAYEKSLYTTSVDELGNETSVLRDGGQAYLDEINRQRLAALSAGLGFTPVDFNAVQ